MSLLFSLVFRTVCRTTHQRLAVDALRHLRVADADRWSDLFLRHAREYLAGCLAPDERFKDFGNHVWYVESKWGQAPLEARRWYGRTVDALRRREWPEAVYSAGVLSHYFSDPFFPLNTGHSEAATRIHRALQWSAARSYGRLQQILEHDLGGYPHVVAPHGEDWIARMICTGAELAHEHYQALLDHFDFERALVDPPAGMDQECQDRVALCLGHAVTGLARVLERAFTEAESEPPPIDTTLAGFLAALAAPWRSLYNHVCDAGERMAMDAALDEMQRTGKVVKNLTDEQREIRRRYAEDVLRLPLYRLDQQPAAITGALYGSGAKERHVPNRLITAPVAARSDHVSTAWRQALQRQQQVT